MKMLSNKSKQKIANTISDIIQTMTYSNMEIDNVEKCLNLLFDISYEIGGVLNTKAVLNNIENARHKERL